MGLARVRRAGAPDPQQRQPIVDIYPPIMADIGGIVAGARPLIERGHAVELINGKRLQAWTSSHA